MTRIGLDSLVAASKGQISSGAGGEKILVHVETGVCFRLDAIGARIWEMMEAPVKVDALVEVLIKEYEVPRRQCENDVLGLLQELEMERLIDVSRSRFS